MAMTKLIKNISGIINKIVEVVIGERRKRVRLKLKRLKKLKKEIMSRPPSVNRSKKIKKLKEVIKNLKDYLQN